MMEKERKTNKNEGTKEDTASGSSNITTEEASENNNMAGPPANMGGPLENFL